MKFFKEYIITAIVGLLLAVVLIVSAKDEGNTLTNAKQRSYDDNWTVQIGKQEKFYKRAESREKALSKMEVIDNPDTASAGDRTW